MQMKFRIGTIATIATEVQFALAPADEEHETSEQREARRPRIERFYAEGNALLDDRRLGNSRALQTFPQAKQQIRVARLFVRRDTFGRFVSCLVYLPLDRYNTAVRHRIEEILRDAFGGARVDFAARVSESVLARLHVRTTFFSPRWFMASTFFNSFGSTKGPFFNDLDMLPSCC